MNIKRRLEKLEEALIPDPDKMPEHEERVEALAREDRRYVIRLKNELGDTLTPAEDDFVAADLAGVLQADRQMWERANRLMADDPWFAAILEEGEVANFAEFSLRIYPSDGKWRKLQARLDSLADPEPKPTETYHDICDDS